MLGTGADVSIRTAANVRPTDEAVAAQRARLVAWADTFHGETDYEPVAAEFFEFIGAAFDELGIPPFNDQKELEACLRITAVVQEPRLVAGVRLPGLGS